MNMITHRVSPQQARYTPMGGREKCSRCRFYVAPKWCGHVIGPVSPMGWCKFFSQEMRQQFGGSQVVAIGPPGATLDLGFMTPGTLDSRISSTRASPATYTDAAGTIQPAAINQPRWDYAGGVLRGLLIEEARTNLLIWSQDITQSAWQKMGTVVVSNTVTAPDGTNTAQTINVGISGSGPAFYQVVVATTGTRYEPSFWINPISTTGTLLFENAVNGANGAWSINMALVGAGWQRITRNHPAVTIGAEFTGLTNQVGAFVHASAGTINASWWGFQIEQGVAPSSTIPTTSVAVTRAADAASMPTAAWFNASAGSFVAEYSTFAMPSPGTHSGILKVNDGTASNDIDLYVQLNTGNEFCDVSIGAVSQMSINGVFAANGATRKAAVAYGAGPWRSASAGTVNTGSGSAAPFSATTLYFGTINPPLQWKLNGWLRGVRYWPRALSNAELQAVTT